MVFEGPENVHILSKGGHTYCRAPFVRRFSDLQKSCKVFWLWQQRLLTGSEYCQQHSFSEPAQHFLQAPAQTEPSREIAEIRFNHCCKNANLWLTGAWFTETSSSSLRKRKKKKKGHQRRVWKWSIEESSLGWSFQKRRGQPDAPLRAHTSRIPMAHSEAVWGLQFLACKSNVGSSDSVISALFTAFRLTA